MTGRRRMGGGRGSHMRNTLIQTFGAWDVACGEGQKDELGMDSTKANVARGVAQHRIEQMRAVGWASEGRAVRPVSQCTSCRNRKRES
jgi:hypothetical protein